MKKKKIYLKLLALTLIFLGASVTKSMAGAWATATPEQQQRLSRDYNISRDMIYRSAKHFKEGDVEPTKDLSRAERLYFVGKEWEAYQSLQRKWDLVTDGEADVPPTPTQSYFIPNPFTGAFSPSAMSVPERNEATPEKNPLAADAAYHRKGHCARHIRWADQESEQIQPDRLA